MSLIDVNYNEILEQIILICNKDGYSEILSSEGAKGYNLNKIESIFKEFNCCETSDKEENFTFFQLDNKNVLLRIKKEKDYMIYHGLVKEEGFFSYYPIQYYNCNFFKEFDYSRLDLLKGNLSIVNNLEINPEINYDEITKFLMKTSYSNISKSHIRIIKRLINSLIQSIEENKTFLIKDNLESRALWVAALQMSMSKELAHSITFSLNHNTVSSNLVKIIGFSEDNESLLDIYINQGDKFRIHDLIGGIESKVKHVSEFSKLVQIAYSISLELLMPFIEFLSKTKYFILDIEIDNCYDLFKLIDNNFLNAELMEFIRAIDFLEKYSSHEIRKEVLKILEIRIFDIDEYIEKDIVKKLILFIVEAANFEGREAYFKKAFKLLFQYINVLLFNCDYLTVEEIEEYYYGIINKQESSKKYLKSYFLGKENLKRLNELINEGNIRIVEFYYPIISEVSNTLSNDQDYDLILLRKRCESILGSNFYKVKKIINH